jgi:hypothetical protein
MKSYANNLQWNIYGRSMFRLNTSHIMNWSVKEPRSIKHRILIMRLNMSATMYGIYSGKTDEIGGLLVAI